MKEWASEGFILSARPFGPMLDEAPAERFDPADLPSDVPVPVLFYATWCGYCRRFIPEFAERAEAAEGHPFVQVDISDEETPLWDDYDIDVVPSVLVFRGGAPVGRTGGPLSGKDLDRLLEKTGVPR